MTAKKKGIEAPAQRLGQSETPTGLVGRLAGHISAFGFPAHSHLGGTGEQGSAGPPEHPEHERRRLAITQRLYFSAGGVIRPPPDALRHSGFVLYQPRPRDLTASGPLPPRFFSLSTSPSCLDFLPPPIQDIPLSPGRPLQTQANDVTGPPSSLGLAIEKTPDSSASRAHCPYARLPPPKSTPDSLAVLALRNRRRRRPGAAQLRVLSIAQSAPARCPPAPPPIGDTQECRRRLTQPRRIRTSGKPSLTGSRKTSSFAQDRNSPGRRRRRLSHRIGADSLATLSATGRAFPRYPLAICLSAACTPGAAHAGPASTEENFFPGTWIRHPYLPRRAPLERVKSPLAIGRRRLSDEAFLSCVPRAQKRRLNALRARGVDLPRPAPAAATFPSRVQEKDQSHRGTMHHSRRKSGHGSANTSMTDVRKAVANDASSTSRHKPSRKTTPQSAAKLGRSPRDRERDWEEERRWGDDERDSFPHYWYASLFHSFTLSLRLLLGLLLSSLLAFAHPRPLLHEISSRTRISTCFFSLRLSGAFPSSGQVQSSPDLQVIRRHPSHQGEGPFVQPPAQGPSMLLVSPS